MEELTQIYSDQYCILLGKNVPGGVLMLCRNRGGAKDTKVMAISGAEIVDGDLHLNCDASPGKKASPVQSMPVSAKKKKPKKVGKVGS